MNSPSVSVGLWTCAAAPGFASDQRAGQGSGRVLFLGLLDSVGIPPDATLRRRPLAVALPGDKDLDEVPGAAGSRRMTLDRPATWTSGTLVRTGRFQTPVHPSIHIYIPQFLSTYCVPRAGVQELRHCRDRQGCTAPAIP